VTTNNTAVPANGPQTNIYNTQDGRRGLRLLDPCDNGLCEWDDSTALQMNSPRWYPTTEVLEDGSSIIVCLLN
jgi:Glyoxal oxidase N-terminus